LLLALHGIILESRVDRGRHETGHELCHHARLFFEERHHLHMLLRRHSHHITSGRRVLHRMVAHVHATHGAIHSHSAHRTRLRAPAVSILEAGGETTRTSRWISAV
jgi:hypothetical protein